MFNNIRIFIDATSSRNFDNSPAKKFETTFKQLTKVKGSLEIEIVYSMIIRLFILINKFVENQKKVHFSFSTGESVNWQNSPERQFGNIYQTH